MKERLSTWLNSLTAKYVAVFTLLVAVPAIGISAYLLDSSYNDNKRALINVQEEKARQLARAIDDKLTDQARRLAAIDGSETSTQLEELLTFMRAADSNMLYVAYLDSPQRERVDSGLLQPTPRPSPKAFESASAGSIFFGALQPQGGGEAASDSGQVGYATMDIIVPSNYGGGLVWAQYAVSDAFQERIAGERTRLLA